MSLLKEESLQKFLKKLDEIVDLKEGEFPKTVCIFFIRFLLRRLGTLSKIVSLCFKFVTFIF
jgi:hypothetical protein